MVFNFNNYRHRCPLRVLRSFIAKIKNISANDVISRANELKFSSNEIAQLENFVSRYESHEPVSKILNKRAFWTSEFFVDKNVLDPRPETEIIVEQALKIFERNESFEFLDIGTGSGCILLSIAKEFPKSFGVGIDISEKAVAVAIKNKSDLDVKNVEIRNVGWDDFIPQQKFDLIVSNPPYIKSMDISDLDDNVKIFDPHIALDGGKNGLMAYEQLSVLMKNWIKPNGKILLEIGFDQCDAVKNIFESENFILENICHDFQQIPRILQFKPRL